MLSVSEGECRDRCWNFRGVEGEGGAGLWVGSWNRDSGSIRIHSKFPLLLVLCFFVSALNRKRTLFLNKKKGRRQGGFLLI